MPTEKRGCLNLLKEFDYFGTEMKFLINNDETYRSKLGGGVFLFYLLITLGYVGYTFYQFAWRQVQTLSYSSKIVSPASPIYLNSTDQKVQLSFGVIYSDNNNFAKEMVLEYLDTRMYYVNYNREEGVKSDFVRLSPCERSNFAEISDATYNFNQMYLNLCPFFNANQTLIQGEFTDQNQTYLSIKINS